MLASSLEIAPINHLGFWPSFFVVYGVGTLFVGTLLWLGWAQVARNAWRARLARQIKIHEQKPLEEGPAVLQGVVEDESEDARPPVRILVHQEGSEYSTKSGWSSRWKETRREIVARAFYLRLPSGERLRVEANQRTRLADELDVIERDVDEKATRRRVAALKVGENVIASGVLKKERAAVGDGSGYRGGGTVMVLHAPAGQTLLLSTSPLESRFQQCMRYYGKYAFLLTFFFAMTHIAAFMKFHRLNASGEVIRGTEITTDTYTTRGKSGVTTHYVVKAKGPNWEPLQSEVDMQTYQDISYMSVVPFLWVPSDPSIHMLGQVPRLISVNALVYSILLTLGLVFYRFAPAAQAGLPWYERRKIVDNQSGRL